jgi:hypothetical protein
MTRTVFDDWDPNEVGSLRRRHDNEEIVLPEDLAIIVENDVSAVPDEILRGYLIKALRGELRRKSGRPPSSLPYAKLVAADAMIDVMVDVIKQEVADGVRRRIRGDLEPRVEAADRVARVFGNFSGRHLLNLISSMKNQ